MKKTLLICFLFLGVFGNAQINFLNHNIIDKSYCIGSVNNVIPFDMDNDGDLDMISSSNTNYIVWQENLDGQGNFGNIHIITDQLEGITSISIADIDNDSDMDIISSCRVYSPPSLTYGSIAWHENVGQGIFTTHILAENLTGACYAKAGDMDGDGDLDIVAHTNVGCLGWFKNTNGLGNFTTANSIATTGLALVTSFDIADADGDGDNDIAVTSSYTDQYMKAGLFINTNGQGNFSAFQLLRNEAPEINYSIVTRVMFQDLDSDGDNDVLFSANFKLIALINAGSGSYTTANIIYSSYYRDRFLDFNVKDMDADGDLDVVGAMSTQEYDKVLWFENDSTHSYTTNHVIQNFTGNQIMSFKIADLDGDNVLDIVTGNLMDNYLVWYKNYTTIKVLGKNCYSPADVQTADLDNDGDLDFISNSGNKLVWYENTDGAGSPGLQKVITFSDICYGYELGDIDGDGAIDFAIDSKWFKNDGLGNFTPNVYVDAYSGNPSKVFIEDVDNDGNKDLIAVDNLSNGNVGIGWYKNLDGLGNFGPRQSIIFISDNTINEIVFKDIDGDGDKDLIFSGGKIGIVKNLDGAGTFSTTFQTVYNYASGKVLCADIDGDGDNDILTDDVYVNGSNRLVWFKNTNGLGTFSSGPPLVVSNSNLTGAFLADMDNDGDLDVISNQTYENNTVWLENLTGLGVFGQPITLIVNPQINSTNNAVDVDNDGKIDILYSESYSGVGNHAVSWFKNNGLSLNKITGTVKLDLNHNGCDNSDNPMPNVKVVTQTSNSDTYSTFTASNGYYQFYVENPGNYTTSVATTLPAYFNVTPNSYITNFTGINNVQALNFCIADSQTVNDLDVAIYPTTEARPGFASSYVIVYHNKGTTPLSGNVKLQFDATKMSFTSANPAVTSQTANELTFNFTNLNPFETKMVGVVFQTFAPPTVNLGNVLSFTGTINPIADDATPTDNIFQLNQTVIGSYDPNDINVLEGESILVDEIDNYLHYVIRFQNTGTASAINVTVTNTLDENLDWDTLQIDGISHNNYISIRNGNQMSFVFKSIYLPYSLANEPGSHGFICYKIKPKNNAVAGDLFHNDAQIYFDYNSAIHTNTVVTEVLNPLSNADFGNSKASLYPNPTNGKIYIAANFDIKSLAVYNIYGQKIAGIQNNSEIDLSGYSVGMYFIKIEDATGKTITKKILKK